MFTPSDPFQADFENHGRFPFLNREDEMQRLLQFWYGEGFGAGMRVMHLTGETEIGKTWLLIELRRRVFGRHEERGRILLSPIDTRERLVHVKFHQDADTSLIPSIAHALGESTAQLDSRHVEINPAFDPVVAALQRLSQWRTLLLVLEDLHLLGRECYTDLLRLMKRLAPMQIAVLVVMRPVDMPEIHDMLMAHRAIAMPLRGFTPKTCALAWKMAFGAEPEPEVMGVVYNATGGNPAALCWALYSVLAAARAARIEPAYGWNIPGRLDWLARTVEQAVRKPALGLLGELTPQQQRDVGRLAQLGAVFAREAARVMVEGADSLIDTLLFRGIIATVATPPRVLPGVDTLHAPLGFTHSLLYRHLAETGEIEGGRLIRAIAECPLYSVVPFQVLAERAWHAGQLEGEITIRAFDRTFDVLKAIDRSAEWRSTGLTWRAALCLMAVRCGAWSHREWERMLVKVINYKLSIALRGDPDMLEHWLNFLISTTADVSSDEMAVGCLHALTYRGLLYSAGKPEVTRQLWEEAEALLATHPHLRYSFAYTDYVIGACMNAYINNDTDMRRCLRERAEAILDSDELPDNVRATFARKVHPLLLSLFETEAELQRSLARVRRYESTIEANDVSVWLYCAPLLAEVAEAELLRRICDRILPLWREFGMIDQLVDMIARRQMVHAGTEASFASVAGPFEQAIAMMELNRRAQFESELTLPLVEAALLRGEPAQAAAIMSAHGVDRDHLRTLPLIAFVLHDADPSAGLKEARIRAGTTNESIDMEISLLLELLAGESEIVDPVLIHTLHDRPILRLTDVLRVHVAVHLFRLILQEHTVDSGMDDVKGALRDAVVRTLDWLAAPARGLFVFMKSMLEGARSILDTKSVADWEQRIADCAAEKAEAPVQHEVEKMKLSMLGAIAMVMPDGVEHRIATNPQQRLLATMVLDLLQPRLLSRKEFYDLAAAGPEDAENLGQTARDDAPANIDGASKEPDNKRKEVKKREKVKQVVYRLRQRFGPDLIDTDDDRPRLNLDVVAVDILEVRRLQHYSTQALFEKSPMRAAIAFFEAIKYVVKYKNNDRSEEQECCSALFPGYSDDLFLYQRQQFEIELRNTAFAVDNAFRRDGMYDDESEILETALVAFPYDDELMERLVEAYARAGKPSEAERLRRMIKDCHDREELEAAER